MIYLFELLGWIKRVIMGWNLMNIRDGNIKIFVIVIWLVKIGVLEG